MDHVLCEDDCLGLYTSSKPASLSCVIGCVVQRRYSRGLKTKVPRPASHTSTSISRA
ncbi:hypothetical protein BDV09DRAFT_166682 [Aspergillus tetrazonus]